MTKYREQLDNIRREIIQDIKDELKKVENGSVSFINEENIDTEDDTYQREDELPVIYLDDELMYEDTLRPIHMYWIYYEKHNDKVYITDFPQGQMWDDNEECYDIEDIPFVDTLNYILDLVQDNAQA